MALFVTYVAHAYRISPRWRTASHFLVRIKGPIRLVLFFHPTRTTRLTRKSPNRMLSFIERSLFYLGTLKDRYNGQSAFYIQAKLDILSSTFLLLKLTNLYALALHCIYSPFKEAISPVILLAFSSCSTWLLILATCSEPIPKETRNSNFFINCSSLRGFLLSPSG